MQMKTSLNTAVYTWSHLSDKAYVVCEKSFFFLKLNWLYDGHAALWGLRVYSVSTLACNINTLTFHWYVYHFRNVKMLKTTTAESPYCWHKLNYCANLIWSQWWRKMKSPRSPKFSQFILKGTNFMAIHPMTVEIFHLGPKGELLSIP